MTRESDLATELDAFSAQDLAQFEPDPDGRESVETPASATADGDASDPQWIVWADPDAESAWAADEFGWTDPPHGRC